MRLFSYLFRCSPYSATLAVLIALVSGVANASLIPLIHTALNDEFSLNHSSFKFIGLVLFALTTATISQILLSHLYRKAIFDWQVRLSLEILKAPLRSLEEIGNADLLTVLVKDVSTIATSLLPLPTLCTNIVIALTCFGYLIWLSWQLFLIISICLLIGAIFYKVVLDKGNAALRMNRKELSQLVEIFHLLTNGLKELKLHCHKRKSFIDQILKPTAASVERYSFQWNVLQALSQSLTKFLLFFVMGIIIFIVPKYISLGTDVLTGYILTLLYMRAMLFSILGAIPALARANIAFEKIEALGLKLEHQGASENSLLSTDVRSWQSVELVNVTHTYYREKEDDNFTLGPINLRFTPGELVFLVGGNGSGKTTLVKLIAGLYFPEGGDIYWDGDRISNDIREHYRQIFSAIFSDFQLFDDFLGLENPHLDAQAREYLTKLQLSHRVRIQNGQMSTTALSRGQQQRLALLVAYLEDRPFYIFDEWASNQDPTFTKIFYTQFLQELKAQGKTVLVVTHDDQYFDWCDRIIKLEHGQIIRNGSNTK